MSDQPTRSDVLTWFRDDDWDGIQGLENPYKAASDLLRDKRLLGGGRLPAGLKVFLHVLPTFLLLFIVVGLHYVVGEGSGSIYSRALSEDDLQLLHSYPELFVVQNTEWAMDDGRVVYSVQPEVMQGFIDEVRDSQEYYRLLTILLTCVFVVASFRLLLVCVWSLLSLCPKGPPRWLDMLL